MYTATDLNFVMIVYVENAKVARIPCNFLMAPYTYERILNHFISINKTNSNYYTSFEIEFQGSVIYKRDISTYLNQRLSDENRSS
jgi:hypothetical protein